MPNALGSEEAQKAYGKAINLPFTKNMVINDLRNLSPGFKQAISEREKIKERACLSMVRIRKAKRLRSEIFTRKLAVMLAMPSPPSDGPG